ncbi:unnamed protein product [Spirodela intermedia]|uniref:Uncharacterized protein n=1 Tax=Spirodela intermedia TaxID=51605 RepID=A0A7I8INQ0_SPIIN|nr:unnamed protein product [Spirodela intermedia]CAA6658771.1 unnamed protein product [Spirodela intermedia]
MADLLRNAPVERDVEQAITALKKGAYLLKYGRRGKPKFCPFRLSNDESILVWFSGKEEKHLKLSQVSKIIPGQRTAIFQRYPRPEKEYQSFSLIYNDRSLDLICKDKDEAEVWFVGLKALISCGSSRKWRIESKTDIASSDTSSPQTHTQRSSPLVSPFGNNDSFFNDPCVSQQIHNPSEAHQCNGLGKVLSDVILYTTPAMGPAISDSVGYSHSSLSSMSGDHPNGRGSAVEAFRVSLSSAVSSSSHGSGHEDFDALGDVFIWGEGVGDGLLGGGVQKVENSSTKKTDALLPKALEPVVVLDVHSIACGSRHAILVTKQGEVFSWGEESGGRLGHGVDADVSHPKLVDALSGMSIELVACGEYHTCAVTMSGDLYTWGDGIHNTSLLGHGSDVSHWIPRKVNGPLEGLHVSSISCGPWHTAIVTSSGQLFTFGDGTFGSLGHGDRRSSNMPREVEALKGLRTVQAACGAWHTAAIVEISTESFKSSNSSSGKLFTWGDGDRGRLGHGDRDTRLVPECVAALLDLNFCQVACGNDMTVALETSGRVYTMGSPIYGQLGCPEADGKLPACVGGKLLNSFVEEIACGSYHVAVLTSRTEVYTWGEEQMDKQVKSVVCGSNFTAAICLHKWVSSADQSVCSGCHLPFGFRRKRHNCYNCGLVFCKACSSRKSLKASLAPNINKPYRVCDECFIKLKKALEAVSVSRFMKHHVINGLPEKAIINSKAQGHLSRLSSLESFKTSESRLSKHKADANAARFSPTNGASHWGSFYSTRTSNYIFGSSKKIFSASVPSSRIASRASSPISRKPSPPRLADNVNDMTSSEIIFEKSKMTNDSLNQEAIKLKLQVEELTRKSEFLEHELEKVTRQLQEATSTAGEESAKCMAAKEVIRSLTAQLKEMAERVKDGPKTENEHQSDSSYNSSNPRLPPENHSTAFQMLEPSVQSDNAPSCNGSKTSADEVEWVEQAEPGVYITVSAYPGGGKYLKRVRFSRKRFSEQQAERWWAENRLKLQDKYIILAQEKMNCSPLSS